jgi:hypothetical protein
MSAEQSMSYSVRFSFLGEAIPPSFMPNARIIGRCRRFGSIVAYEAKSEIISDGGLWITVDVPSLEIATELDIGWFSEGCFMPLVIDDRMSAK